MAYEMPFRVAVARAHDECGSSADVAAQFECSESWVRRLIQRRELTGSLAPLPPRRPDTRRLDDADLDRVRALVAQQPDLTLAELAAALDGKASVTTVWRATQRLGLTLKKSPRTRPSRTARTSGSGATVGSTTSRASRSPTSCSSTSSGPRRT